MRSLGCDPDAQEIDIVDGLDIITVAMSSFPPRVCGLREFYPDMFPKSKKEKSMNDFPSLQYDAESKYPFGSDGIGTAEQFEQMARSGWAERGVK